MLNDIQKCDIINKYKSGSTIAKISNDIGINPKTVNLWLNRYIKTGTIN